MINRHLPAVTYLAVLLGRAVPAPASSPRHRAVAGALVGHRAGAPGSHMTVPGMVAARSRRRSAGGPSNLPFLLVGGLLVICLFVTVAYLASPRPADVSSPPALSSPHSHAHLKGHR